MDKLSLNIFDDEIDAIMDDIPEELWYNKTHDEEESLDSQYRHLQVLSTW
jgi:hypothetical protein